jgi:hypothetical protein
LKAERKLDPVADLFGEMIKERPKAGSGHDRKSEIYHRFLKNR